MPTLRYTVPPEKDGAPVRHILKAELHFSARAISRLTRTEGGILRNGQPVRTVDLLHTGDELSVLSSDLRPAREQPLPCDTPLPIVWEDGPRLVVHQPAGLVAMGSWCLPETAAGGGARGAARPGLRPGHPARRAGSAAEPPGLRPESPRPLLIFPGKEVIPCRLTAGFCTK